MMNTISGVSTSFTSPSSSSSLNSLLLSYTICSKSQFPSLLIANYRHNHLSLSSRSRFLKPIYCSSSPGSGEKGSKTVLDAFFLGKALGEALTERIESTVGEILSTIGRLQAEQQKQVQEFQEDVLERAKRAKEKAAREALEEQGRLITNSSSRNAARNGASSSVVASHAGPMNPSSPTPVVNPDALASSGDEGRNISETVSSVTIEE